MFSNFVISCCVTTLVILCPTYKEIDLDCFLIRSMSHRIDLAEAIRCCILSLWLPGNHEQSEHKDSVQLTLSLELNCHQNSQNYRGLPRCFFHCLDSSPYALNNNTFVVRTVCAVRSSFMFYISSMGKMFKKHNSIINIGPPALLTAFSEEIVYFTASSQTSLQYELFLPMEKKTVMSLLLYHPPTPIPPFYKKWIQEHCFVSLLRKQLQCYSSYSMVAPYTGQLYIYAI